MTLLPLPAGVRRFALDRLPAEPWRNGAGWTRTVAVHERGGDVDWRVSAADITHAGPFSRFDGMDRTAVLIQGPRLQLEGSGQRLVFEAPGHLQRFSGEQELHAVAPEQPARLWNVMARRGQAEARVEVHRAGTLVLAAGDTSVLLVFHGQYQLCAGGDALLQLEAGEGLYVENTRRALELHPAYPSSSLVHTRFRIGSPHA
ncbi:HutD/Ves family protein [Azohydromonas aeria]|uniref:HutD/Ves family protein n=1 Tax=Azohydromonas aeria TaxID=2590212 RepID=UPI0012F79413|nr:HutD family protein [Azohydromonas aeria]